MKKKYVVFLYAKFGGEFWKMDMVDIDELVNVYPKDLDNEEKLTSILQKKIDEMKAAGEPIPEPKFTHLDEFTSTYNIPPKYKTLEVEV